MSSSIAATPRQKMGFWPYIGYVIRGGKPPPEKRWSPVFVSNLVCGSLLVGILLMNLITSNFRVGLSTTEVKCLPGTIYLVRNGMPSEIVRGQIMAYRSSGLAPLLKDGSLVAKIVAGVPGDRVVVDASGVAINGKHWGPLNLQVMKKTHKTVASVTTDYVLKPGQYLVLGTEPRTYDSRYWGPINVRQLVGKAWRVW